jgi:hypothetical protein
MNKDLVKRVALGIVVAAICAILLLGIIKALTGWG